jgi:cellulose synthase/poly-beta-1,6-N-acetylglucosamine synthase-like glycosyltransferase
MLLWIFLAVVAISIVTQSVFTLLFVRVLSSWRRVPLPDSQCPPATIVLCLRGGDPFLPECLQAALSLDYPHYELLVIVDHRNDPAWLQVERAVTEQGATNIRIQALREPLSTCSLKCSSLLQAVEQLADSCQILAQLDADTIVHPSWLRELAGALADPLVGAATGNRWYMPQRVSAASLVRYLWNAAAVVQMFSYRIAWGGTLAVKTSVLRDAGLPDRWSRAFCEDTMLKRALRPLGLRVAFVPSLLMVNRESCDMLGFYRWCTRQLLTARLYHPYWGLVAFHGVFTTALNVAATAWLAATLVSGHWSLAGGIAGGLAAYQLMNMSMLALLEHSVRRIVSARSQIVNWIGWRGMLNTVWAIPLTQLVYAASLFSATFLRRVEWRGVTYRINGPWKIKLLKYEPFNDESRSPDTRRSL